MSFHADRESGCGGKCSAIRIAHGVITALMAPGAKSTERLLKKSLKLHASCLPRNVDRKAVSTLVLLVSQSRARLQHYLRTAGLGAGAEQARFLLAALCNSGVGGRAIGEVVSLDRLVEAGLFTTTEFGLLSRHQRSASLDMTWPAEGASRLATERSLPKWVVREWVATYGAAAASRIAAASNRPGPVTLRANVRRGDRRQLQASLEACGIRTTPTRLSPWGLRVISPEKPNIWGAEPWKRGEFEVQDEGSQLVALACTEGGKLGPITVDYCCGRGGKTLSLAMLLDHDRNPGIVLAHDIDTAAIRDLNVRAARAGVCDDIRIYAGLGLHEASVTSTTATFCESIATKSFQMWDKNERVNGASAVLVDAPCSRLGILRRGPGTRWELPDPGAAEVAGAGLPELQLKLLANASKLVAPGGLLVYATCTLNHAENENVTARFEAAAADKFVGAPLAEAWGGKVSATSPSAVTLMPGGPDNTDGYFIARWRRSLRDVNK